MCARVSMWLFFICFFSSSSLCRLWFVMCIHAHAYMLIYLMCVLGVLYVPNHVT